MFQDFICRVDLCATKVNETHAFVAGGYNDQQSILGDAYLIEWNTFQ